MVSDQFCSLVYSLSNLYFVVCAYSGDFDSSWARCSRPKPWGIPLILGILPFIARLVQSIKRWYDSGLETHLINVMYPPRHGLCPTCLISCAGREIWSWYHLLLLLFYMAA